jgi:hypothetical protein
VGLTLRDKVELYENFLIGIAKIDVEKECAEALVDPGNPGVPGTDAFISKYPFAFGMISRSFKNVVSDAQYALKRGEEVMDRVYTQKEMLEFVRLFNLGSWPNQRFGQAFCNHFNRTDHDLFYQTQRKVAEEYIWLFLIG